jgi:hypothetical protein
VTEIVGDLPRREPCLIQSSGDKVPERVWVQTLPWCLPHDVPEPHSGIVRISDSQPREWKDPLTEGVSVFAQERVLYPARRIDRAHVRLGLCVRLNDQPLPPNDYPAHNGHTNVFDP